MPLDRFEPGRSHRAGAVNLTWELASQIGFVNIIDEICCGEPNVEGPSPTPEKLLTAWAINRAPDPMSNAMLENRSPTTDLPRLMGLEIADLSNPSASVTANSLSISCHLSKPTLESSRFN